MSQHVIDEPFEPSPFMTGGPRALDSDFSMMSSRPQRGQTDVDTSVQLPTNDRENNMKENNVAKIKVVVRFANWSSLSCLSSLIYHESII